MGRVFFAPKPPGLPVPILKDSSCDGFLLLVGVPTTSRTGQVNGRVWKTDDSDHAWTPIFDVQPTQSIDAIAVTPCDPNIIYVGSGEGLQRPDLSVGGWNF